MEGGWAGGRAGRRRRCQPPQTHPNRPPPPPPPSPPQLPKVYSELIGNIAIDAASAKKYYHFVRLMGRAASHVTLECALQTHPQEAIICEEVDALGMSLADVTSRVADVVCLRAAAGKHYGVVLIPEGLIEHIPQMRALIAELNDLLATASMDDGAAAAMGPDDVAARLSPEAASVFAMLPPSIRSELLLERDPHGNVQARAMDGWAGGVGGACRHAHWRGPVPPGGHCNAAAAGRARRMPPPAPSSHTCSNSWVAARRCCCVAASCWPASRAPRIACASIAVWTPTPLVGDSLLPRPLHQRLARVSRPRCCAMAIGLAPSAAAAVLPLALVGQRWWGGVIGGGSKEWGTAVCSAVARVKTRVHAPPCALLHRLSLRKLWASPRGAPTTHKPQQGPPPAAAAGRAWGTRRRARRPQGRSLPPPAPRGG